MYWTLIIIGLIILGVIFLLLDANYYNDILCGIGVIIIVLGVTGLIFIVGLSISARCLADKHIHESELARESIIKQLEAVNSDYEDVSKSKVIQRVYEWNQDVYDAKYWADSKWTNWLFSKKYTDSLKYIELED